MATGYWPPDIPFDEKELLTVMEVLKEQNPSK